MKAKDLIKLIREHIPGDEEVAFYLLSAETLADIADMADIEAEPKHIRQALHLLSVALREGIGEAHNLPLKALQKAKEMQYPEEEEEEEEAQDEIEELNDVEVTWIGVRLH